MVIIMRECPGRNADSIMSNRNDEAEEICASCGTEGGDGAKLKRCSRCKLVAYCNITCQKKHWSQHKRTCGRRAAELREELLFKQPKSSHYGDCPICFLPLPSIANCHVYMYCCSKTICHGCNLASQLQQVEDSTESNCPFCRTPAPCTDEEAAQTGMRRIEANDPHAIRQQGVYHYKARNYSGAFECWTKTAGLGDVESHYHLAVLYAAGKGVAGDEKKVTHHLEEAAIGGHPTARHSLGIIEGNMGNIERATKHHFIAARLGHREAMENVKEAFMGGFIGKAELEAVLRAHKAARDDTQSPQREAAARALGIPDTEYCSIKLHSTQKTET